MKPYQRYMRLEAVTLSALVNVPVESRLDVAMTETTTIQDAREFARQKHTGQVRKHDGCPYIVHLDGVVSILTEHGYKSADLVAAAFVHDTLEKTDTTLEELLEVFGEPIAELVHWLTDSEKGSRAACAMHSAWRLSRSPWDAKLIKLADIIDNASAVVCCNPSFSPTFLEEKRLQLKKMAEIEGSRLLRIPLFQKAALVTEATSL